MENPVRRILDYNRNREAAYIRFKYQALAESPYRFFRGTAHLFYDDFPKHSSLRDAPATWLCGDLHLENFGSYKSAKRLVYFDINDFDEAWFGPCSLDLTRMLTSIVLSGRAFGYSIKAVRRLCELFMKTYAAELAKAHASRLEHATSTGIIEAYFATLKRRKREQFIGKRTVLKKRKPKLMVDNEKFFPIKKSKADAIRQAIRNWAKERDNPEFFEVHDVVYRQAGTGSLGLRRYAILVEGNGYPKNYILDLKEQVDSSLQVYFPSKAKLGNKSSDRIVAIQRRMQDRSSAFLSSLRIGKTNYVLKELQPLEDRINLQALSRKKEDLEEYIRSTACLLAWAQLRSSGLGGSATADVLIVFSEKKKLHRQCVEYAMMYAGKVEQDFELFKAYHQQKA